MEILLVSADQIKTYTNISENTSDRILYTAILDAQQIELQSILGSKLYKHILSLVESKSVTEPYKTLLEEYIQPYLIRLVGSTIVFPIAYKIGNIGVAQANDTNLNSSSFKEISYIQDYYNNKANVAKKRLQDYLADNRNIFPELIVSFPEQYPNLYSSSSCPIWIGGVRGKC